MWVACKQCGDCTKDYLVNQSYQKPLPKRIIMECTEKSIKQNANSENSDKLEGKEGYTSKGW